MEQSLEVGSDRLCQLEWSPTKEEFFFNTIASPVQAEK